MSSIAQYITCLCFMYIHISKLISVYISKINIGCNCFSIQPLSWTDVRMIICFQQPLYSIHFLHSVHAVNSYFVCKWHTALFNTYIFLWIAPQFANLFIVENPKLCRSFIKFSLRVYLHIKLQLKFMEQVIFFGKKKNFIL